MICPQLVTLWRLWFIFCRFMEETKSDLSHLQLHSWHEEGGHHRGHTLSLSILEWCGWFDFPRDLLRQSRHQNLLSQSQRWPVRFAFRRPWWASQTSPTIVVIVFTQVNFRRQASVNQSISIRIKLAPTVRKVRQWPGKSPPSIIKQKRENERRESGRERDCHLNWHWLDSNCKLYGGGWSWVNWLKVIGRSHCKDAVQCLV